MPAKHPEPLARTNVLLPQSDMQRLRRYYPHNGAMSQILRALLRRHLTRLDQATAAKLSGQPHSEGLPPGEILSQEELNDR